MKFSLLTIAGLSTTISCFMVSAHTAPTPRKRKVAKKGDGSANDLPTPSNPDSSNCDPNCGGDETEGSVDDPPDFINLDTSGKLFSPKEIAKAWKEYDNGTYKDGCANAMAIALGEGIIPALQIPLNYICDPTIPTCPTTGVGCLGGVCWEGYMTLDQFLDVPAFDLDQKAYDTQPTLGPWQSTSDVPHTEDVSVRVAETVNYVTTLCNPKCTGGTTEGSPCSNPEHPDLPLTTIFDDVQLQWCGCAPTSFKDESKQTYGYSGRCSQGAADHYTKYTHSEYQSIANKICDSV